MPTSRDSMTKTEYLTSDLKLKKRTMRYVSLHHHSTYSFLDGYGQPKDHIAKAAELGMYAMALTEHGNVSSHPKLEQAAVSAGIKPIFGCELYCGEPKTKRKNHLTALAMNEEGYRNLLRMLTWAWNEGFYYEPTVQGPIFADHSESLIVASGCLGSLLATSIIGGKNIKKDDSSFDRGLRVAEKFQNLLGDRYYLEVQAFPELGDTSLLNPQLEKIGRKLDIPLVATADVHYCRPDDNEMQTILHAVRPGQNRTFEEQARAWGYDVLLCHPTSDKEIFDKLVETGLSKEAAKQAIESTNEISERCTVKLPKAAPLRYPLPDEAKDTRAHWHKLLREGWEYRKINDKPRSQEYAKRLGYEVGIIEDKSFVDYFLIVADMTRWAKDHGIFVGPARGSAAGSLVCYLLRITEVDPLMFKDLIFERFIDVTRTDLPDIDLDFDDQRRHEIFEYLAERYGSEKVRQLGTFTTYKSKNSLDDVARVFVVPKWEVEKVKNLLIERSSGDLRASATIEDTVDMFKEVQQVFEEFPNLKKSMRLEGMVKGMGRHAAGAIVASTPLTETCAIYGDTVSLDKYDAEYMNLLKIDVLGLSTCGMLALAMEMLGKSITYLYDVPLDDPETIRGFQENDIVAVFQFDGRAMRLVNHALKPDNFYEVCVVNALARPGPLHNNATMHYTDIKHGRLQPEVVHPLFDEIVKNTQYQVVYQEQILRIVREIGNFDWTHAAYIRKIISRKVGEQEFNRQWERFWKGAKKNGLSRKDAKKIWGMCITAGAYAFNAAHSVSYGMLGYWTMWLKRHHPLIFYVAALKRLPKDKQLEIMRDAARHGIKVLPPDPRTSDVDWSIEGKSLRAGFKQIFGIGEKQGAAIVSYREQNGLKDWEDLIGVKGIGEKTILKILEFVNREDPLGVHVLDRKLVKVVKQIKTGKLRGTHGRRLPVPTHTVATVPYGRGKDTIVTWIGVIAHRNLRDLFEVNFSRTGIPLDPKEVKNPELREWVLLHGSDGDDILTITIDRWRYPKFRDIVWNLRLGHDIVLIKGIKKGNLPHKQVYVSEMTVIE